MELDGIRPAVNNILRASHLCPSMPLGYRSNYLRLDFYSTGLLKMVLMFFLPLEES